MRHQLIYFSLIVKFLSSLFRTYLFVIDMINQNLSIKILKKQTTHFKISTFRSLPNVVPLAVDLLVGFLADEYHQVSETSAEFLKAFSHSLEVEGQRRHLIDTLQENLYSLSTSLPRQMRMAGLCVWCLKTKNNKAIMMIHRKTTLKYFRENKFEQIPFFKRIYLLSHHHLNK